MTAQPLFLDSSFDLEPANAVAAILLDEGGRYVMQHRDSLSNIFYPDHWGCFGGAIEKGENPAGALQRELQEELELQASACQLREFTRFDFDFSSMGKAKVYRIYFEVRISDAQNRDLRLHEGQAMGGFAAPEILDGRRVTPYDAFAIWMHYQAARRASAAARVP